MLWKGPGISKSIVPGSALTPPGGEGNGLQGEFRFIRKGSEDTVTRRIDPNLDLVWNSRYTIRSAYRNSRAALASRVHVTRMSPSHLAECEGDEGDGCKHTYFSHSSRLELLSSQQRAEFVDEVLTRPALLKKATLSQVAMAYFVARIGAMDAALDMLGKWCQLHADQEPKLSNHMRAIHPEWHHAITIGIVWQYRPHLDLLEERYLEMPDGRCSLPAAYMLANGYLVQGKIDQWIEKLDIRLQAESLTGDPSVNWLLARAYAQEICQGVGNRRCRPEMRPLAGRGWIQTACLMAQTEPVKLRAYKELIIRHLAAGRYEGARQLIATAQERLTTPESAAALNQMAARVRPKNKKTEPKQKPNPNPKPQATVPLPETDDRAALQPDGYREVLLHNAGTTSTTFTVRFYDESGMMNYERIVTR